MTQKEILKGNKLIAEFMEPSYKSEFDIVNFNTRPDISKIDHSWFASTLEYHKNWNWLMPVVEKIAESKKPFNIYFSHIQNSATIYELKSDFYLVKEADTIRKPIEIVYEAVIQFITYYNTQQK